MSTTIQVNRLKLITELERTQRGLVTKKTKSESQYKQQLATYRERLAKKLESLAKDVRKGVELNTDSAYRNHQSVKVADVNKLLPEIPEPPEKDCEKERLERLLANLRLSDQPTIPMNENSEYIKLMCEVPEGMIIPSSLLDPATRRIKMPNPADILAALPSTEPASFNEFLAALGSDAPERGDRNAWHELFEQLEFLESCGLVEIERANSGGAIDSLMLTPLGAERVREQRRERRDDYDEQC